MACRTASVKRMADKSIAAKTQLEKHSSMRAEYAVVIEKSKMRI